MAIEVGSRVGPFEVRAFIGEGGMGRVFRAFDSKLQREVALKVLPDHVADDADRVARFHREAHALAALNHPNIAQIYGFEECAGARCLVLELVHGETLEERLSQGPLPIYVALKIAKQIAEALETAHECGIIHRDLKPANIKITADGIVKVLDFGLAKAVSAEGGDENLSHSPTMLSGTIGTAVIGTAAYMSPEQARGRSVDKRADVWAFGCVFFEMLSGLQAFRGEDITEITSKVMQAEPEWNALPTDVSDRLQRLLRRCLKKDPRMRLRDIGDAILELEEIANDQVEFSKTPVSRRYIYSSILIAVAVLFALVLWILGFVPAGSVVSQNRSMRFSIVPPLGWRFVEAPIAQEIAISPDEKRIAFTVTSASLSASSYEGGIAIRPLDSLNAEIIPGTEGGAAPFWSPDGRYLGFLFSKKMKRIDLLTNETQLITDFTGFGWAAWGGSGTILFSDYERGLLGVSASGGAPQSIVALNTAGDETAHFYPAFSTDPRRFFFSTLSGSKFVINIGTFDAGTPKQLTTAEAGSQYAGGYLFFVRGGKLLAQRFDESSLSLQGEPVAVAEAVWVNPPPVCYGAFAVSRNLIAFSTATVPNTQLVWLDRSGREIGTVGTPDKNISLSLSGRNDQAAVIRFDTKTQSSDIWRVDLATGTASRFTFDQIRETSPIWSADGESLIFSEYGTTFRRQRTDGSASEQFLDLSKAFGFPTSSSPDGKYLAYYNRIANQSGGGYDIDILDIPAKKIVPGLHETFNETDPQISSDGKWLAYVSDESDRNEVYVRSFPGLRSRWQISIAGGSRPRWRQDAKELFFLSESGQMISVELHEGQMDFAKIQRNELFKLPGLRTAFPNEHNYDVSKDGKRFLFNKVLESSDAPTISVITNWQQLVKR